MPLVTHQCRRWERITLAENQHSLGMMQVPSDDAPIYQVGQNALDFIKINVEFQPFKGRNNFVEWNNMLFDDIVNTFEQIAVA